MEAVLGLGTYCSISPKRRICGLLILKYTKVDSDEKWSNVGGVEVKSQEKISYMVGSSQSPWIRSAKPVDKLPISLRRECKKPPDNARNRDHNVSG